MKRVVLSFLSVLILCGFIFGQNLTVRDIMREPSIAGMRAEGERLSPDGKFVVFLWNTEGKMPRNLYIVSTDDGKPRQLLTPNDLLAQTAQQKEQPNALNYGLELKDEFARARENQISILDWSPDSRRLLLGQNGDLFLLEINGIENISLKKADVIRRGEAKWREVEALIKRRVDLLPNVLRVIQTLGIQERETLEHIADTRLKLLNLLEQSSANAKSDARKQSLQRANENFDNAVNKLLVLQETYPALRSSEAFANLMDELSGVQNRLNVSLNDYKLITGNAPSELRRLTKTQASESGARFLNDSQILFQQNGNFFVVNTENLYLVQVSKEANPQAFITIFNPTVSENDTNIAYIVSDGSKQRALFVPNYLDQFTTAPTFRRGWTEQKVLVTKTDGSLANPIEIKLPKAEGVSYIRGLDWAADNSSLIVDRIDQDTKRRQLFYIYNAGGKDEKTILVTEETDAKWVAPLSRIVEPNPKDAAQVLFASERDGFNHLYLATLEKVKAEANTTGENRGENSSNPGFTGKFDVKQLTRGNWQVEWAKWFPQGNNIVFSSTKFDTQTREFFITGKDYGASPRLEMPNGSMKTNPQMSEGENPVLIYELSKWNQPGELFSAQICLTCQEKVSNAQLTQTSPESFLQRRWNEPKFIDIPSKDKKKIPAKIYLPADFNKSKKYPMVIFVHGAGYLQNVINGWNNYYREFMFNQLLTQKGYVVLDIDYRGSAGYGRDWRTDVHDFLGGSDYEDHIDSIDFMVANYSVNPQKVGVYGGSYGGFMAGMLVMRAPDKIAAAAALRPVFDWKNYFYSSPVYTTERLGFPDKNAEAYKRSSPISYADKLQKPLLILHGLVDDNVHAQDSIQLIEKLMRLEKTQYFEAMLYPSENHAFQRPSSWADEYERILTFFEKHLK